MSLVVGRKYINKEIDDTFNTGPDTNQEPVSESLNRIFYILQCTCMIFDTLLFNLTTPLLATNLVTKF